MKRLLYILFLFVGFTLNAQVNDLNGPVAGSATEIPDPFPGSTIDSIEINKVRGDSIVWDDLRIVPGAFSFPGNADPTLGTWQPGASGATFRLYKFNKNDEAFASTQMPHKYKEGSDLQFHIHWTPHARGNEETGATVGWKVDYTIADVDENFVSSSTVSMSDACAGVDDRHEVSASVTVSGTGLKISHVIFLRIYRSDTGADDTWSGTSANAPGLLEFDIHFQSNTEGSMQEFIKY